MTESAYPATVLVTRRLLADVLFGLAERAFPKLESRDPGGTRRLVESMIADVAIEGTPAPAETPDSTTQNPCGFRIAMGEVHVCAFPKGHSGDLHRADYEASSVWFRSDPRFWFAANSPADLGVCHRCGNEIPHFAPLTGDTLATSGFYYVRGGAWERFARGNGELYVCDACMWADPQYIAEYGRAPTGTAADPDATASVRLSDNDAMLLVEIADAYRTASHWDAGAKAKRQLLLRLAVGEIAPSPEKTHG